MNWQRTRLKYLAARPIVNGLGESAALEDESWPRYIRTTDFAGPRTLREETKATLPPALARKAEVRRGDLLMSAAGTVGKTFLYNSDAPACYAGYLVRFRPTANVDPRFVAYWTETPLFLDQIETGKVTSTIDNFSASKYQNLSLSVPDRCTQQALADYLDSETARIDALISKRQRVREEFAERRIALSHWLLAGPEVAGGRKPGPTPWLDSVPEGWDLVRVGHLFEVQLGRMLNHERSVGLHQRPYMRNANVGWGNIDTSDVAEMDFPPGDRARYRLRHGDLLICEGGAGVAECAVWRDQLPDCYYQKSLHRVRPRTELPVEWLAEWLRLWKASGAHEGEGNLATIPHLTAEQLRGHRIPVPPTGNARARLAELGRQAQRGLTMDGILRSQVRLLRERRQALITAAVTGELEVPGVAA